MWTWEVNFIIYLLKNKIQYNKQILYIAIGNQKLIKKKKSLNQNLLIEQLKLFNTLLFYNIDLCGNQDHTCVYNFFSLFLNRI